MLSTALRVLARRWPALLAWFLVGWAARALLIRLAGFVGIAHDLFGLLVLPLAILAQLAAFVGMFLVVRGELRHLDVADDPDPGEKAPTARRRWTETLLAAILPFFVLYVAWDLIQDDLVDYRISLLGQADLTTLDTSGIRIDVLPITIVVVAFVLRWLLGRFAPRLPRWTSTIATYLEAVWTLIALLLIRQLVVVFLAWLSTRRMFGWAVDAWADVRATFAWLGVLSDGVGWVLAQGATLVALPLAWLAFAAIVYFGTLPRRVGTPSGRVAQAQARWESAPSWVRRAGVALSTGFLDRWRPVALAARLIWSAGPVSLGLYLLTFALVTALGDWLRLLIFRLVGPHDTAWWFGASDGYELAVATFVAVLQVAVVAAAFDHALRSEAAKRVVDTAGDSVSSAAAPAAEQPTT